MDHNNNKELIHPGQCYKSPHCQVSKQIGGMGSKAGWNLEIVGYFIYISISNLFTYHMVFKIIAFYLSKT